MLFTEFGMLMDFRSRQPQKAPFPILVMLFGIIVFLQPQINVLDFVSIMALLLFLLSYIAFPSSTIIELRALQFANSSFPMFVTLFGIAIVCKLLQPIKALEPMLVTLFGIVIDCKLLQSMKTLFPMLATLFGIMIDCKLLQP